MAPVTSPLVLSAKAEPYDDSLYLQCRVLRAGAALVKFEVDISVTVEAEDPASYNDYLLTTACCNDSLALSRNQCARCGEAPTYPVSEWWEPRTTFLPRLEAALEATGLDVLTSGLAADALFEALGPIMVEIEPGRRRRKTFWTARG